jgi:hypothetical protein
LFFLKAHTNLTNYHAPDCSAGAASDAYAGASKVKETYKHTHTPTHTPINLHCRAPSPYCITGAASDADAGASKAKEIYVQLTDLVARLSTVLEAADRTAKAVRRHCRLNVFDASRSEVTTAATATLSVELRGDASALADAVGSERVTY